jgi:hypothetical protein
VAFAVFNYLPYITLSYILVFLLPFYSIPLQLLSQDSFPLEVRVGMCSLAHAIGSITISGTVPFIGMLIWKSFGVNVAVCYSIFLLSLILVMYLLLRRTIVE